MKNICILGISGSVGSQTYDVIKTHPEYFNLVSCSVFTDVKFLDKVKKDFPNVKTCVSSLEGIDGLYNLINDPSVDMVVNCISGVNGLKPSIYAIEHDKVLCVANKETIIIGGDLLVQLLKEHPKSYLIPLDSEHSSLFQLLLGEQYQNISKLIITASGGPFIDYSEEKLKDVKPSDAIKHPTWKMGNKISIDSATMFNKGLEIMEVHYLFGIDYDCIEAVIERSSNVHALVAFKDGSMKALLANPSMKQPISFALSLGQRLDNNIENIDLSNLSLNFEKINSRAVDLAYEAGKIGGSAPIVYCVSNEETVNAFMSNKISFLDIYDVVNETLNKSEILYNYSFNDIDKIIDEAKKVANEIIERRTK